MTTNTDSEDDDNSHRIKLAASTLYDESIDVTNAEEVRSPTTNSNKLRDPAYSLIDSPPLTPKSDGYHKSKAGTSMSNNLSILAVERPNPRISASQRPVRHGSDQSDNSEEDEDEEDDDDDVQAANVEEEFYDPTEFDHLPVSADIKDLFQNITRYTPQNIQLEYKLTPFIPDFIPAVGDIDAFLKVPRPDGKADAIGLEVLDEPCASQSEPAVLHLQLRAVTKQASAKTVVVKKVEGAEKNTRTIDRWIKDISDLHRSKPPPTVHYSKSMPDVDNLMQEWPTDLEQQLREMGLPTADLDCDLATYVDIICSLFDIPIYESRIQSLHVLFSLYSAVRNSQYFNNIEDGAVAESQGDD